MAPVKIAIVTDSTAYLPKDVRERLGIRMIPLSVIFGDETYREEIDMTADEFFVKIKQSPKLPTTSQPSVGEFVDLFTAIREEGYDAVISIHLSSGISGTYQGAVTAGTMVDGLRVYAYDSEISCMAQGFYAIEAAEMAKAGKMPEEILARLDEMKRTLRAYFMVDDLSHLQRGGRLTGAQAFIGGLLQIKPLLRFENKVIVRLKKSARAKRRCNASRSCLTKMRTKAFRSKPLSSMPTSPMKRAVGAMSWPPAIRTSNFRSAILAPSSPRTSAKGRSG